MRFVLALLLLSLFVPAAHADEFIPLFDGTSLKGWEGNLDWFRVEEGAIVGGTLEKKIPHNEFLATEKEYENFELRLKVKAVGKGVNAGIQFRSQRIPNHHEVIGYQADVGGKWWGALYDESRRRTMLDKPDDATREKIVKFEEWNDYVIRCEGPRIQLWLNGVKTVDFVEKQEGIARTGMIAVQIHGGPPSEAWYKDIQIRELP